MNGKAVSEGLAKIAGDYLAKRIERYGKVENCEIDLAAKQAKISLLLEGEKEPISVAIGGLKLVEKDGGAQLKAGAVRISRAWLHKLAIDNSERLAITIPNEFLAIVKTFFKEQ